MKNASERAKDLIDELFPKTDEKPIFRVWAHLDIIMPMNYRAAVMFADKYIVDSYIAKSWSEKL